ncbi:hypothetical protein ABBQ32_011118 [Trebouxia sp. C0010 RCD-2024]
MSWASESHEDVTCTFGTHLLIGKSYQSNWGWPTVERQSGVTLVSFMFSETHEDVPKDAWHAQGVHSLAGTSKPEANFWHAHLGPLKPQTAVLFGANVVVCLQDV